MQTTSVDHTKRAERLCIQRNYSGYKMTIYTLKTMSYTCSLQRDHYGLHTYFSKALSNQYFQLTLSTHIHQAPHVKYFHYESSNLIKMSNEASWPYQYSDDQWRIHIAPPVGIIIVLLWQAASCIVHLFMNWPLSLPQGTHLEYSCGRD